MKKYIFGLMILSIVGNSCSFKCVEGNGDIQTQRISINSKAKNFDIEVPADIKLVQSDSSFIEISGDKNFIDLIEIKQGKTVDIGTKKCIRTNGNLKIIISNPVFEEISLDGSVNLNTLTPIKSKKLYITTAGTCQMNIRVNTEKLIIKNLGASQIKITGKTKKLDLRLKGSALFVGDKLISQKVEADIGGAGNCSVYATDYLDAQIDGSAILKYFGNPRKVNTEIYGSGKAIAK